MSDGGRLRDPGQGTTKASTASPGPSVVRPALAPPRDPVAPADGDDVADTAAPDRAVTPRALPDPGQDSTQRP